MDHEAVKKNVYNSDDTIAAQEEALASAAAIVRQLVETAQEYGWHHGCHDPVPCQRKEDLQSALIAARAWLEQEGR